MNQEYFDEYERFYDFTEENEAIAKKLQEKYKNCEGGEEFIYEVPEKNAGEVIEEKEDDDEWADCDDDSNSVDMLEEKPAKIPKMAKKQYRMKRAKLMDTGELLLPSGMIAGHRDFANLYKQRPRIHTEEMNVRRLASGRGVYGGKISYSTAVMLKSAMKNGTIMQADYNRYLAKERAKVDKRLVRVMRKRDDMYMKLGVAGNLTLRTHFRDSTVIFC